MRLLNVRPADPASVIPMPDRPLGHGRFERLPVEGREVDVDHAFWSQALRDGSIVEAIPDSPAPVEAAGEPAPAKD